MPPSQQQQKEKACIAAYLQQTGLATAIRDSLKSLFAEPRLPDNPYYYLASALGAYVDQNDLWQESDLSLLTALDNEGGLEVADQSSRLCKLAACGNVWGLPHMLRCVSKEGVRVVQDVLSNSLPDSFFPGPMPFSNKDGYTMQVLASVQGTTAVWRPQWMEFPELAVRADVVVRGPRLDEALGQLAGLLAADLADLDAVPVFFVQGLQLVAPLAGELAAAQAALAKGAGLGQIPATQAAGSTAAAAAAAAGMPPAGSAGGLGAAAAGGADGGLWTLADMTARPDEFRKALSRAVLAHKCVELRAVLMLEAPADAAHLTERKLRFEVAVKRYVFHFWPTVESSTEQPTAAAGKPGKAKAKAKTASSYSATPPQQQVAHYGSTPHEALYEGYCLDPTAAKQYVALFHADREPYSTDCLRANSEQLANLVEACMLRGATLEGLRRMLLLVLLQDAAPLGPGPLLPSDLLPLEELLLVVPSNQAEMLLSVVPNLLRMINSGAGMIQGSGIFSGISVILSQLLGQLPGEVPADPVQCRAALAAARGCVESLQQLLEAAALTLADALLDRCRDVMWALHRFGVRLVDSVMARAALVADEGEATPEWVLHVGAITDAQIRSGAVAERVAREGVMLQYAVDAKLDVLLSSLYGSVTQPPMPLNPYPRLLHFLRAHAARLDLWKEDMDDACAQLLNQLELLQPPGFIYAAKPPEGAARAGRRARQRRVGAAAAAAAAAAGGGLDDDDSESATVYGSYAAVTLCDGRSLQSLASSLGGLLSERHWQQGGTSCDVLPALAGDAWLSGALALAEGDDEGGAAAAAGGRQRSFGAAATAQRAPFEQPRFFRVDAEEHHQVSGPDLAQAAALFAAGVVDHTLSLHQHTQHIVHQLRIGSSNFGLATMLTQPGREAAVSALAKAVRASAARRPATHGGDCVAVLELLAAAKEGLYVRLVKHLHFAYQRDGLPHDTTNTAAVQHRAGEDPA
ncbi:hypothetical protein OEZ86_000711 [Tetradesmus obliquus]|nr:hypothetical protein OEZ86_000711 [Tetradesmus obliquus]